MNKNKKNSMAKYIIGSLVLAGISMIVIPQIIEAISSDVYSKMPRNNINTDDDDWGPIIVKRTEKENN